MKPLKLSKASRDLAKRVLSYALNSGGKNIRGVEVLHRPMKGMTHGLVSIAFRYPRLPVKRKP